jgi:hypothetical protein
MTPLYAVVHINLWLFNMVLIVYPHFGTETISIVLYLFGRPSIYTSSLEVAKQVVSTKSGFYKAEDTSAITL